MYLNLSDDELRTIGRRAIENFERWARRIIDEKCTQKYSINWIEEKIANSEYLIKKEVRENVNKLMNQHKQRCTRTVDALFLDDIIYLLCTDKFYNSMFKEVLNYAYPQGNDEAREFLSRLIPIRNKLSHSNCISVREIEKAICYSNDFIDSVKKYYISKGQDKMYNVPTIVRIVDSLGNESHSSQINRNSTGRGSCTVANNTIRAGEVLSIEAEVDPAFTRDTYEISWLFNNKWHEGNKIVMELDESCVRIDFTVYVKVVSKEHQWHRCGDVDDMVSLTYSVLPPI